MILPMRLLDGVSDKRPLDRSQAQGFDVVEFVERSITYLGAGVVEMQYRTFSGVQGRGETIDVGKLGDALSGVIPDGYAGAVLAEMARQLGPNRVHRYPVGHGGAET